MQILSSPKPEYPKPSAIGGKLIREVIAFLKQQKVTLPISSDILIATSGGTDSMALAHLVTHYGQKIRDKKNITLIHINHHWRGKESNEDACFVENYAKQWGISFIRKDLKLKNFRNSSLSWEETARKARKKIFLDCRSNSKTIIFTAHHADDLAETLLWRLFTGANKTHGGGIVFQEGNIIRPFLRVRKKLLKKYLLSEGIAWREDRTNFEGRFLRSKIRLELLPVIEKLFPRATDHLIQAAFTAQKSEPPALLTPGNPDPTLLFSATGLKVRRIHWEFLKRGNFKNNQGELHLPQGWRLQWKKSSKLQRFLLEKQST